MIQVDEKKFRLKPYDHQKRGVLTLLKKPTYGLFWRPRLGKTKTVIDAACIMFEHDIIDTVLVVAPAQVKDVWLDKTFGEIVTHDWSGAKVYEFKALDSLILPHGVPCFLAASVEFLRQQGPRNNFPFVDNLLAALSGRRVWFVYDEASTLGNWDSLQTRSMIALRNSACIKRVTELDGTPGGNHETCYYSKFKVLDPNILGCRVFRHFQNRYFETVKVPHKWKTDPETGERKAVQSHVEMVKVKNWDDFIRRTSPYCEFLEQDQLDMPEKIPSILTVAMGVKAWKAYQTMRDEMVAELDSGVCAVGQAAVKCIRLAQICAGFLGGVVQDSQMVIPGYEPSETWSGVSTPPITVEVDDATARLTIDWLKMRFAERPDFKTVIWSRFVPEIERLVKLLEGAKFLQNKCVISVMYGAQKYGDEFFHPKHPYQGPMVMVAQPQAVQYGKNYSKADTNLFLSGDYNRVTRTQAEQRTEAHGARQSTSMIDVVVTGPRGQRTIVHDIIKSVRDKEDTEKRTTEHWKKILTEE